LESLLIPDHILRDPRLLVIWRRSHHILSPAAFEERYERTLLLPLEWPQLRKQVALLKALIDLEPGIIPRSLSERSGIKETRCRQILYSREWIEWYSRRYPGSTAYHFFPTSDDTGRKLLPEVITVEYLAAEFERLGFEFRVVRHLGLNTLHAKLPATPPAGCLHYFHEHSDKILQYILKRDGNAPS
jgi:hypothetical protein